MDRMFITPTQSVVGHAIFSQTGPLQRVDAWLHLGSTVKRLSQTFNDTLPQFDAHTDHKALLSCLERYLTPSNLTSAMHLSR